MYGKTYSLDHNPANCLDYDVNTGQVGMHTCQNVNRQQWTYDTRTSQLVNANTSCGVNDCGFALCLSADGGGNGASVSLQTCDGGWVEKWNIAGQELVNRNSGLCLDDASHGGTGPLVVWNRNGQGQQNWYIVGYTT
ncbi:ricin-type beta-trefoil lectin domain protein [Streptomyces sp. NPDC059928]|uniref:ricin-type beta-trefoil lectin domain protein n=1 Tax=unclassified Streptomyces TaxID=2593676 RepID=UPI003667C3D9